MADTLISKEVTQQQGGHNLTEISIPVDVSMSFLLEMKSEGQKFKNLILSWLLRYLNQGKF